jgi:hypothetical protein
MRRSRRRYDGLDFSASFTGATPPAAHEFVMSEIFGQNLPNAGTISGNRAAITKTEKLYWNTTVFKTRLQGGLPEFYLLDTDPHELTNKGDIATATASEVARYIALYNKAEAFYADVAEELGT